MVEVVFTPKRQSVETWKMFANSTMYCVEGTEIPISQALTLDLVMPSCFASSDCVLMVFSLRDFILSAIMFTTFLQVWQNNLKDITLSKRYYELIDEIDNRNNWNYNDKNFRKR